MKKKLPTIASTMTRSLSSFLRECAGKEAKRFSLEMARMTPTASRASSQVKRMLEIQV